MMVTWHDETLLSDYDNRIDCLPATEHIVVAFGDLLTAVAYLCLKVLLHCHVRLPGSYQEATASIVCG